MKTTLIKFSIYSTLLAFYSVGSFAGELGSTLGLDTPPPPPSVIHPPAPKGKKPPRFGALPGGGRLVYIDIKILKAIQEANLNPAQAAVVTAMVKEGGLNFSQAQTFIGAVQNGSNIANAFNDSIKQQNSAIIKNDGSFTGNSNSLGQSGPISTKDLQTLVKTSRLSPSQQRAVTKIATAKDFNASEAKSFVSSLEGGKGLKEAYTEVSNNRIIASTNGPVMSQSALKSEINNAGLTPSQSKNVLTIATAKNFTKSEAKSFIADVKSGKTIKVAYNAISKNRKVASALIAAKGASKSAVSNEPKYMASEEARQNQNEFSSITRSSSKNQMVRKGDTFASNNSEASRTGRSIASGSFSKNAGNGNSGANSKSNKKSKDSASNNVSANSSAGYIRGTSFSR